MKRFFVSVVVLAACSTEPPEASDLSEPGADAAVDGELDAGAIPILPEERWVDVLVDFDDLESGDIVTDQYGRYVRFSGETPETQNEVWRRAHSSNYILTYNFGGDGTTLDFVAPARHLTFRGFGINNGLSVVAIARFTFADSSTAEHPLMGTGDSADVIMFDAGLSYEDIVRLEIAGLDDPFGIAWDDFSFQVRD